MQSLHELPISQREKLEKGGRMVSRSLLQYAYPKKPETRDRQDSGIQR